MLNQFSRTQLLLGNEAMEKLQKSLYLPAGGKTQMHRTEGYPWKCVLCSICGRTDYCR